MSGQVIIGSHGPAWSIGHQQIFSRHLGLEQAGWFHSKSCLFFLSFITFFIVLLHEPIDLLPFPGGVHLCAIYGFLVLFVRSIWPRHLHHLHNVVDACVFTSSLLVTHWPGWILRIWWRQNLINVWTCSQPSDCFFKFSPGHARVSGNEQADRLVSTADIWSAAWQGRGAQRLEELSELGQARASQHWLPEEKRRGERKRLKFHPLRSGTICVQPDKHWHCFEGSLGETAERQGGAGMGHSECYDAVLNWNWNWNQVLRGTEEPNECCTYRSWVWSLFIRLVISRCSAVCWRPVLQGQICW